jgi:SAM-dependent methyltransferase
MLRRAAPGAAGVVLVLVIGACAPRVPGQAVRYSPTPHHVVVALLRLAGVGPQDTVYDLGSGDGRIVIAAARDFGARAVGVEIDRILAAAARQNVNTAGVGDRVRIVEQDIFDTDLAPATVVALYLSEAVHARLRPKLLRELRPGTRVVSYRVAMDDWLPARTEEVDVDGHSRTLYLWIVPAASAR